MIIEPGDIIRFFSKSKILKSYPNAKFVEKTENREFKVVKVDKWPNFYAEDIAGYRVLVDLLTIGAVFEVIGLRQEIKEKIAQGEGIILDIK